MAKVWRIASALLLALTLCCLMMVGPQAAVAEDVNWSFENDDPNVVIKAGVNNGDSYNDRLLDINVVTDTYLPEEPVWGLEDVSGDVDALYLEWEAAGFGNTLFASGLKNEVGAKASCVITCTYNGETRKLPVTISVEEVDTSEFDAQFAGVAGFPATITVNLGDTVILEELFSNPEMFEKGFKSYSNVNNAAEGVDVRTNDSEWNGRYARAYTFLKPGRYDGWYDFRVYMNYGYHYSMTIVVLNEDGTEPDHWNFVDDAEELSYTVDANMLLEDNKLGTVSIENLGANNWPDWTIERVSGEESANIVLGWEGDSPTTIVMYLETNHIGETEFLLTCTAEGVSQSKTVKVNVESTWRFEQESVSYELVYPNEGDWDLRLGDINIRTPYYDENLGQPLWGINDESGDLVKPFLEWDDGYGNAVWCSAPTATGELTFNITCTFNDETHSIPVTISVREIDTSDIDAYFEGTGLRGPITVKVGEAFTFMDYFSKPEAYTAGYKFYEGVNVEDWDEYVFSVPNEDVVGVTDYTFIKPGRYAGWIEFRPYANYGYHFQTTVVVLNEDGTEPDHWNFVDEEIVYNVSYESVSESNDLGKVWIENLSFGNYPEWELTPVSGEANADLWWWYAEEPESIYLAVNPYHVGEAEYLLTCTAEGVTQSIPVKVTVENTWVFEQSGLEVELVTLREDEWLYCRLGDLWLNCTNWEAGEAQWWIDDLSNDQFEAFLERDGETNNVVWLSAEPPVPTGTVTFTVYCAYNDETNSVPVTVTFKDIDTSEIDAIFEGAGLPSTITVKVGETVDLKEYFSRPELFDAGFEFYDGMNVENWDEEVIVEWIDDMNHYTMLKPGRYNASVSFHVYPNYVFDYTTTVIVLNEDGTEPAAWNFSQDRYEFTVTPEDMDDLDVPFDYTVGYITLENTSFNNWNIQWDLQPVSEEQSCWVGFDGPDDPNVIRLWIGDYYHAGDTEFVLTVTADGVTQSVPVVIHLTGMPRFWWMNDEAHYTLVLTGNTEGWIDSIWIGTMGDIEGEPEWSLEHVSGDSADLWFWCDDPFGAELGAEPRHAGESVYELSATYNGQTKTCPIYIMVEDSDMSVYDEMLVDESMPNITLHVGDTIRFEDYFSNPAIFDLGLAIELPNYVLGEYDVEFTEEWVQYKGYDTRAYTFLEPGYYSCGFYISLAKNWSYGYGFVVTVLDEDGNEPEYNLELSQDVLEVNLYADVARSYEFHIEVWSEIFDSITPVYTLEHVSGDAATLTGYSPWVDNFYMTAIAVPGKMGDVKYNLIVEYLSARKVVPVTVHVVSYEETVGTTIPSVMSLTKDSYTVKVGEPLTLYGTERFYPAGTTPAQGTTFLFSNVWDYEDCFEDEWLWLNGYSVHQVTFTKPGYYALDWRAEVHGTDAWLAQTVYVTVVDEEGNVPEYELWLDRSYGPNRIFTGGVDDVLIEGFRIASPALKGEEATYELVVESGDDLGEIYLSVPGWSLNAEIGIRNLTGKSGPIKGHVNVTYAGKKAVWYFEGEVIEPAVKLPESFDLSGGNVHTMKVGETFKWKSQVVVSPADSAIPEDTLYVVGSSYENLLKMTVNDEGFAFNEPGIYVVTLILTGGDSNFYLDMMAYIYVEDEDGNVPDEGVVYYGFGDSTTIVLGTDVEPGDYLWVDTNLPEGDENTTWELVHVSGDVVEASIRVEPTYVGTTVILQVDSVSGQVGKAQYQLVCSDGYTTRTLTINIDVVDMSADAITPVSAYKPVLVPAVPVAGEEVFVVGGGVGGTGEYSFAHYLYDQFGNILEQSDPEEDNDWLFTAPTKDGRYMVRTFIMDGNTMDYKDTWFTIGDVSTMLTIDSITVTGDLKTGSEITATATLSGGIENAYPAYNFYLFDSTGTIVQSNMGVFENSWTFTVPKAGIYVVRVDATDGETSDTKDGMWFGVEPDGPLTIESIVVTGTRKAGNPLTATVTLGGNLQSVPAYNYYLYDVNGALVQSNMGVSDGAWTFTPARGGIYLVRVDATDGVNSDTADGEWFLVEANDEVLTIKEIAVSGEMKVGSPITAKVTLSGGIDGAYPAYNFYLFDSTGTMVQQNMGVFEGSWTFTVTTPGIYVVRVDATDGVTADSKDGNWFRADPAGNSLVISSIRISGTTEVGARITATANLSGVADGAYPAYNFYLFDGTGTMVQQNMGVFENTWTFTVPTAGIYLVRVDATDGVNATSKDGEWFAVQAVSTTVGLADESEAEAPEESVADAPVEEPEAAPVEESAEKLIPEETEESVEVPAVEAEDALPDEPEETLPEEN